MPSGAVNTSAYIMGAADIYYREVGVLTAWTNIGRTLDDAVARITTESFSPDNIAGVLGPVMGLRVLQRANAEIEFTMPEVAGSKLALAIPGSRVIAAVNTVDGAGLSTTTTAAIVAGATTIALTAATNLVVGDYIKIGAGSTIEYRRVTGIASLNVSFRDPLLYAQSSGVAVVETLGDNRTTIRAPIIRRQPDTAYKEWSIVAESGQSGVHEILLPRGIATADSAELTFGDSTLTGVRVTISGNYDRADINTSPFDLITPSA